ncbi:hypothetical protein G6M12_01960 [Agrobacterium tumefaciens]|nr:hypothetical protein [Agrobacterium tumefaciens]
MSALFDSNNARWLSADQVAKTFILRKNEFDILSLPTNTLMVGPRGSGKTTLLKMLTIRGLSAWGASAAKELVDRVDYRTIFLGADKQFDLFVRSLGGGRLDAFLESLSKTLVSLRIKAALIDTVRQARDARIAENLRISKLHIELTSDQEYEVSKFLSTAWGLEKETFTFSELRAAIHLTVIKINQLIDRFIQNKRTVSDFSTSLEYKQLLLAASELSKDPITSIYAFIDAVEDVTGSTAKWCLCVDEMEILPDFLQNYFFSFLRSTDHRLILKLATSPFSATVGAASDTKGPMPDNDYRVVNLAFPDKPSAIEFSKQIFSAIAAELDVATASFEDVLGSSPLSFSDEVQATEASSERYMPPMGVHYRRFNKLKAIDPKFAEFLRERNIDLDAYSDLPENRRAIIRKHIWPAALRLERGTHQEYARGNNGDTVFRRTSPKRISDLYLGAESIFTLCEGNPRNAIGILRPLIKTYADNGQKQASFSAQAEIVSQTIAKYLSLLSAIPVGRRKSAYGALSVVKIIDEIGNYFARRALGPDYPTEYASTITVSRVVNDDVAAAIGAAMNQGAFVMVSDATKLYDFGAIYGSRLRLSYLLAPRYQLALVFGSSLSLRNILKDTDLMQHGPVKMGDLFQP